MKQRWLAVVVIGGMVAACDPYDTTTNADFFELFADGFAGAVNSASAGRTSAPTALAPLGAPASADAPRRLPVPDTADATVPCSAGELQFVADVTDDIQSNGNGYVAVNVTMMTVPPPGNNSYHGCVVDGDDISGYMQLLGNEVIDGGQAVPPTFAVNGSWTTEGCGCCVQLSLSAAQGWNGAVCGVAVVDSTIGDGDPVCSDNCGG